MDKGLFHAINGLPEWLSPFFVFLSEASKIPVGRVCLIALALALLVWPKSRKATILAMLAWPLANAFSEAFKTAIPMLRPCVELPDAILRVGKLTSFGTASSHSANMAAVAFVYCAYHRKWGWIAAILAFLTGISRIYVGVHYPSQVVFGWATGIICGLIVVKTWEAWRTLRSKKTPHVENTTP